MAALTALTLDVDWAPDFAIDAISARLDAAGVPSTWFATHDSPAIRRLRAHPLVEVGLHPNFRADSSHGAAPDEVLRRCFDIVPGAISARNHGLLTSTHLLVAALDAGLRCDLTLYLPDAPLMTPHRFELGGRLLYRLHHQWEDDLEMVAGRPPRSPVAVVEAAERACVLAFHPLHVYLNARDMRPWNVLRAEAPFTALTPAQVDPRVTDGDGAGAWFDALVDRLARDGNGRRVGDLLGALVSV